MRKLRAGRLLRAAGVVLFVLALVGTAGGTWLVRRSFPRTQGVQTIPGLDSTVDVYRSPAGVPHVYASTEHDLFFAQGYTHAQDRFWQMDFFRHVGSGRLAEMFGESQLETDVFLRTMGWERVAEEEYRQLDTQTRRILETYAEGVNAYLANHRGSAASLEYAILSLLNPGYEIQPWDPVDTLVWGKAMAWDLGSNMDGEIDRARLLSTLTRAQIEQLYPAYPAEKHPIIVPGSGDRARSSERTSEIPLSAQSALARTAVRVADLDETLGVRATGIGSNSWTVGPSRTRSGAAMLANDTHLGIQMPSIWYENGLHCRPVSDDCRFDVVGFSFAGVPTVIIGHNGQIAWGVTNLGADVQDLYIERIHPDDPMRYEVDGEWRTMETVQEQVRVAGQEPTEFTVRYTHHGPIISDAYARLEGFGEETGIDLPEEYAISLRWTALEPTALFQAVIGVNLAQDWESFRAALQHWDVPSQNFVYADREGNIGYQMPGKIPIRGAGNGWLPSPGWDSSYDWQGYIPFGELASLRNPEAGFVVAANNAAVGPSYPYFVERGWDYGYRAARISSLLENQPQVNVESIAAIHGDTFNAMGPVYVPLLTDLSFENARMDELSQWLGEWDHHNDLDSGRAALFNSFWHHLLLHTFRDELPDGPLPGGSRALLVMEAIAQEPDSPWWDNTETSETEVREDVLRAAFASAVEDVEARLGTDRREWRWGDLHTATFRNQSLGESGVAPIEALFNRGPFATAGGSSIVNATSWNFSEGYAVTSIPAHRLIVDLADFDESRTIHTTGQSGHAFHPHYIDQADPWRKTEYHQLAWTFDQVVSSAASHLQLQPVLTE